MSARHLSRVAVAAATALALVVVPAAVAGKPGGGGGGGTSATSGLRLVLLDGATEAKHGGRITFAVTTTATDRPYVGVKCYQSTNYIYDAYVGYFPTYMFDQWLILDSSYWAAGTPATCNARLFRFDKRGNQVVLATMSFPVSA